MRISRARIISFILSAIFIIASAVVYSSLIVPSYGGLMKSRGELEATRLAFETEKVNIEAAEKLLSEYRERGVQIGLESLLPSVPDTSGAVSQISGAAELTGLAGAKLRLTNISSRVLEIRPSGDELIRGVGVIELAAHVSGSYEELKAFIKNIETNIRLMNIKDITVSPAAGLERRDAILLDARFTVHAYYQAQ